MGSCRWVGVKGFRLMEINLSKRRISGIRKKQRIKYWFNRIIIWGIVFLGLLLIGLSGWNLLISRKNQALTLKIESLKKEIQAKSKIETQQIYLTDKLASFNSLIKTHELHQDIAETVFALIPDGTSIQGFEITETGLISLNGSVSSWEQLNQLLENVKRKDSSRLAIKQANMNNINFSIDSAIGFNLEIQLAIPK